MLIKVLLRALTWAAETSFSGRGGCNCVSFFCFPPCFLASPQLQWLIVLPSFMEEGKSSCTGQDKSPAAVLLTLPSSSHSAHAGCTGLSEACLEAHCSSWCISVSFPISLCDPCSTSTCKVKSLLFWPTLDLLTLAVVTDCSRLLFQSHLFLCGTHSSSGEDKECLKPRKAENISIGMFCWWTEKTHGQISLSSLKHLEVWLSIRAKHARLFPAEHQYAQLMVPESSCGEFSQENSTASFSLYAKPEKVRVHSPNKFCLANTWGRQGELISHWSLNSEVVSLQGDTI